MLIDYDGANVLEIAIWILIVTAAGFLGRVLVKGKNFFGLWGDAFIGLLGVLLIGTLLRAFKFSLTGWLTETVPDTIAPYVFWLDIGLCALVGAIVLRAILRPFTGGG
ncbi:MAG TPA: hypothetical protein VGO52_11025 [Hyphomonadaceae bacterium]|jgi:uncharacterized membrane protein YeaQ/YmgE (transglycosylase-associated protein family)|nr:hypothetical protein [Hyphomonadaceae bacterium]